MLARHSSGDTMTHLSFSLSVLTSVTVLRGGGSAGGRFVGVKDFDDSLLADAVRHFSGIHPNRQVFGQITQDLLDVQASVFGSLDQHRVRSVEG